MTTPSSRGLPRTPAIVVALDRRASFLPLLFGSNHFLAGEQLLYRLMSWLSPGDYAGGYWEFLEHDGVPLYAKPPARELYQISCESNGFSGAVSADAAGVIATLFTLSHLSFKSQSASLSTAYHRLYAYACDHPEARAIFGAID